MEIVLGQTRPVDPTLLIRFEFLVVQLLPIISLTPITVNKDVCVHLFQL